MSRKSQRERDSGDSLKYDIEEVPVASDGSKSSKKRSQKVQTLHLSGFLLITAHKLKETDMERVALEIKNLKFEHDKYEKELKEHSEGKGGAKKGARISAMRGTQEA